MSLEIHLFPLDIDDFGGFGVSLGGFWWILGLFRGILVLLGSRGLSGLGGGSGVLQRPRVGPGGNARGGDAPGNGNREWESGMGTGNGNREREPRTGIGNENREWESEMKIGNGN